MPLQHPSSPPPWLPAWMPVSELQRLYPPGSRQAGLRSLGQGEDFTLEWDEAGLRLLTPTQRACWRLGPDRSWGRSCSCGFPGALCPHTYAAALLFDEVCRRQGWGAPSGARVSAAAAPAAPPAEPPSRFNLSEPLPPPRPQPRPPSPPPGSLSLLAEMDGKHQPPYATLRFYRVDPDGRRELFRIQGLYSEARYQEHSPAAAARWDAASRRLFRWLSSALGRRSDWVTSLQVIKLTPAELAAWQPFWEQFPDRIIDRHSQRPLWEKLPVARLRIGLAAEESLVRIAPRLCLPDGRELPLHQALTALESFENGTLACGGKRYEFTEPRSTWQALCRSFSKGSRTLPADKVEEHLGSVIDGRFDLLDGPLLAEAASTPLALRILAAGHDFLLRLKVGRSELPLAACRQRPPMTLVRLPDGRYQRQAISEADLALCRSWLEALPLDEQGRLQGTAEHAAALRELWLQLPEGLAKETAPELVPLFAPAAPAVPELDFLQAGESSGGIFKVSVGWRLGGVAVDDRELRSAVERGLPVLRTETGRWLALAPEQVREAQQRLSTWGMRGGGRFLMPEARRLAREGCTALGATVSRQSLAVVDRLVRLPPRPVPTLDPALAPVLRDYQRQGFEFLAERWAASVGAILADDMGLGKTLQALALIASMPKQKRQEENAGRGVLIVCPASVVSVWLGEAAKFCPGLRCQAYLGVPEVRKRLLETDDWECLVTTYGMVRSDIDLIAGHTFELIVLDEAQTIKNPAAKVSVAVRGLRAPARIALTGTPLENRLLDFWSIMDFLNPGFLGSREEFQSSCVLAGLEMAVALRQRIAPLLMRRTKDLVAKELPLRTEETLLLEMGPEQQQFYDQVLMEAKSNLLEKGPIELLAALTRLRQVCCHPALVGHAGIPSEKLETLMEMLAELLEEGHSVLVFSQFVRMLEQIQESLQGSGIKHLMITGETAIPERQRRVSEFQDSDDPAVFLLSLKAAGTGLTLTKADYVFIFDPWWNPAVERQAIDRTHRIGQDKPIIAYRLVMKGSIEEKVLALQEEKKVLFDALIEESTGVEPPRLSTAELQKLLL